jgi:hypothetical protein
MMKRWLLTLAALPLVQVGCDDHSHGGSVAADACEHFANGPIVALTAASDAGTAPRADLLHTRYDVQLIDVAGTPGGVVAFAVDEAGEYNLFLDAGVTAGLAPSTGGEPLAPELEGTTDADCADVARWYTWDLEVGTYVLTLTGQTGIDAVSFVRNTAEHDHHDH